MSFLRQLAKLNPVAEEHATWWDGLIELRIQSYFSDDEPPLELVSSIRAIVFRNDTILVTRNADSTHIVPGGRREAGEDLETTVRRELLEETGWEVGDLTFLGFVALHHLLPKPEGYRFLYPDFLWVVFMADAKRFVPDAKLIGDYEEECQFKPLAEAEHLALSPFQRVYLGEAIRRRAVRS